MAATTQNTPSPLPSQESPVIPISQQVFKRRRGEHVQRIFMTKIVPRIFLIAMCLLFILPLYWMIATSLKSDPELAAYPPTWYPEDPQWHNFPDSIKAFTDDSDPANIITFWTYAKNTVIITVISTLGAVIANPMIGYGFSRINWPGRNKVFFLVLSTTFVPGTALMVAMFDIWAIKLSNLFHYQFIDTFWPLTIGAFFGNATWIFMMRQFYMQIPKEMSDAAKVDGANEFQVFWQIIMPQARAAVGTIGIFAAVGAWNDFMGPLIYLQTKAKYTLALGLSFFQSASQHDVNYAQLMAASTIVVVPVIITFLFFQRNFTEGISVTGIKG